MELKAILTSFEIKERYFPNEKIIIYSDSAYCVNALTSWIYTWFINDWKNSKNKTIENLNLFQSIYLYYNKKNFINQVKFKQVQGHAGVIGNELSDALAQNNLIKFNNLIKKNQIKTIYDDIPPFP